MLWKVGRIRLDGRFTVKIYLLNIFVSTKAVGCKASIGMPAKLLIEAISNTDKVCEWNKTLTEARVLKTINKDCVISYQVR